MFHGPGLPHLNVPIAHEEKMLEIIRKYIFPLKIVNFCYEYNKKFKRIIKKNLQQCREYCHSNQSVFPSFEDHNKVLETFEAAVDFTAVFNWSRDIDFHSVVVVVSNNKLV